MRAMGYKFIFQAISFLEGLNNFSVKLSIFHVTALIRK
jgi:hypothetical protein